MSVISTKYITYFRIILIILCQFSIQTFAQKIGIESFMLDESDLTAQRKDTEVHDQNGDRCALIKVLTTQKSFTFDAGMSGITRVEEQCKSHPAEIWVYVPYGVKRLSLQHPILGSIKDYDLGCSVQKGKTYILKLSSDEINTLVVDYQNSMLLRTKIYPSYADFHINGMKQSLDENGEANVNLSFGTYTYRVSAQDYHTVEGIIEIGHDMKDREFSIRLKQAFGYLNIKDIQSSDDVKVYIDDVLMHPESIGNYRISSGTHRYSLTKKFCKPYTGQFLMTDSATMVLKPKFEDFYGTLQLSVAKDHDAEIYLDDSLLASGSWRGKVEVGQHVLEVRKPKHRSISQIVDVMNGENLKLELMTPTPICGSAVFTSTPAGAKVTIDGTHVGDTPLSIPSLIIGNHNIEVTLAGHKPETFSITIEEGQSLQKDISLVDYCNAFILTHPSHATVRIDGETIKNLHNLSLPSGKYLVDASAKGYVPFQKTLELNGSIDTIRINLKRNFVRNNEVYCQTSLTTIGAWDYQFGGGLYIHNWNAEYNEAFSIIESDRVYWIENTLARPPFSCTYSFHTRDLRVGYGFVANNRIRLTPQVGVSLVYLQQKNPETLIPSYQYGNVNTSGSGNGAWASFLSCAMRASFSCNRYLGLFVSPSYRLAINSSSAYQKLKVLSPKINDYNKGFCCAVGVYLFF